MRTLEFEDIRSCADYVARRITPTAKRGRNCDGTARFITEYAGRCDPPDDPKLYLEHGDCDCSYLMNVATICYDVEDLSCQACGDTIRFTRDSVHGPEKIQ